MQKLEMISSKCYKQLEDRKLLFFAFISVFLILRRPTEFLSPYVWSEDGTWNIPHFLEYGIGAIWQPVQGYMILPAKLINLLLLKISFLYYPEVSTLLSVLFSICCIFAVAYSPTTLKYKVLCAFGLLLIPLDPEVFILPLYSFWWGALLIFISLLWDNKAGAKYFRWRVLFTIVGGLSSPLVIACVPLFVIRSIYLKGRSEYYNLLVVLVVALVQGYYVVQYASTSNVSLWEVLISFQTIIGKFFGNYLFYWLSQLSSFSIGLGFLLFIMLCLYIERSRLDLTIYFLIALVGVSILLSIKRVPVEIIDLVAAGPRYFYYPFITITWLLIWFIGSSNGWVRYISVTLLLFPVVTFIDHFSRNSVAHNWRAELLQCVNWPEYDILIKTDGLLNTPWYLKLKDKECQELINQSVLDKYIVNRVFSRPASNAMVLNSFDAENMPSFNITKSSWKRGLFPPVSFEIGNLEDFSSSWVNSDSFVGDLEIDIKSNSEIIKLAYVTGPVADRQIVEVFDDGEKKIHSSPLRPTGGKLFTYKFRVEAGKNYHVRMYDGGADWGEWSAIYIPKVN